jgi:uncharacterized integral membrane protein
MPEKKLSTELKTESLNFLLEDYKQAREIYKQLNKRITATSRFVYIYFAVMLGFLSIWITVSIYIIYNSWGGDVTFGGIIFARKVFPLMVIFIFFLIKGIFYRMHKQEFFLPKKAPDQ